MVALLSFCESCDGTAGAKVSSFPKAGLIDSYRFSLCAFASGCLSTLGTLRRSGKRLTNFSPLFKSSDSSLIFTLGTSVVWMPPESATDCKAVFTEMVDVIVYCCYMKDVAKHALKSFLHAKKGQCMQWKKAKNFFLKDGYSYLVQLVSLKNLKGCTVSPVGVKGQYKMVIWS